MEVYRVEDANGFGPYNYRDDNELYHPDTGHQPTPWNDGPLALKWEKAYAFGISDGYRFGFESLDQLQEWFNDAKWRQRAESEGFRLATYEVDEGDGIIPPILLGNHQLCFWKARARLIRTAPLSSLS